MPAIAAIVINDGQATPVAHTFNPTQTVPPTYRENGDSAVPTIGEPEIILTLKKGSGAVQKAVATLRVPVLETTTGSSYSGYEAPPKVAYYMQANIELFLPNRSTGAQRKDLRVLASNLLQNAQLTSLVEKLEQPY
jgi:hypothetical protein